MDNEEGGGSVRDPDTPQQKYYTIMIERIPPHFRSAEALYTFFNNLFPGEVYSVEVSLDLKKLNAICSERRNVRDSLEEALATYEATNIRPTIYINTGNVTLFLDDNVGIVAEDNSWRSAVQKFIAPGRIR